MKQETIFWRSGQWLALLALASLLAAWPSSLAMAQEPEPGAEEPRAVPGEVLIIPKEGLDSLSALDSLQLDGVQALEVSPVSGLISAQVEPGQEDALIAELTASGLVEVAARNYIVYAALTPNDPYYSSQWALPKIQAPNAWNYQTGSSQLIVGIVDSGLDLTHPEFSGRIVNPWDAIDDDSDPQDTCGHGTHVTGIAAARGNNNQGVAGTAWNVKVLPVRVLTKNGSACDGTVKHVHNGIYWAVDHGADIINLSLGGKLDSAYTSCMEHPEYSIMGGAVQYAFNQGVLVVAASGNAGASRVYCPALQSEALAVGATNPDDTRWGLSNYGSALDLVAPGATIYSTLPDNSYGYLSGTSMAAPYVSGLAALLWSMDSSLSRDQVRELLAASTDDLGAPGKDIYFGYGRINAWRTLESTSYLGVAPGEASFKVDDDSGPYPGLRPVNLNLDGPPGVTAFWTAQVTPKTKWLKAKPGSDTVAVDGPDAFSLVASRPLTYGVYTTTVLVTATTGSGVVLDPSIIQVSMSYTSHITHELALPIILKGVEIP